MDQAIRLLASPGDFEHMVDAAKVREGSERFWKIVRQRAPWAADISDSSGNGHRTQASDTSNAAAELRQAMGMNYASALEAARNRPGLSGHRKGQETRTD